MNDRETRPANGAAVQVNQLRFGYGVRKVLKDLSLDVPTGATYALLGANGAGKSTLLRVLAGMVPPYSGQVRVLGTALYANPSRQRWMELRQRIAYVAAGQQLPDHLTLRQLLAYCAPLYPSWDFTVVERLLDTLRLDMGERLSNMSRGQRMQAALLCALAPRPALLLLDEPFTGLDLSAKDAIVRAVLELAADEQWTVIVATHDVSEIEMLADWVGFLRDGRIDVSEPLDVLRARHGAGGEGPVTLRDLYLSYAAPSTESRRSA